MTKVTADNSFTLPAGVLETLTKVSSVYESKVTGIVANSDGDATVYLSSSDDKQVIVNVKNPVFTFGDILQFDETGTLVTVNPAPKEEKVVSRMNGCSPRNSGW